MVKTRGGFRNGGVASRGRLMLELVAKIRKKREESAAALLDTIKQPADLVILDNGNQIESGQPDTFEVLMEDGGALLDTTDFVTLDNPTQFEIIGEDAAAGESFEDPADLSAGEIFIDQPDLPVLDMVLDDDAVREGRVGVEGRKKIRSEDQRAVRQLFREKGKVYTTVKGKEVPSRSVKSPCKSACKKKCSTLFLYEERQNLHREYWDLGFIQKREFLMRCIKTAGKSRETVENSRRKYSRRYCLPKDNDNIEVCKKFFQATLDVGAKLLRYTENNVANSLGTVSADGRGKQTSKNKTPPHCIRNVRNFIENLPAVNSHYCRSSSTKKYVPQEYESLSNIFRKYQIHCQENAIKSASDFVFKKIFKTEYNIGIHAPKKDKCSTCISFVSAKSPSEAEQLKYKKHIAEKEAINKQYRADQDKARTDKSFITCSFDLQKVLNTPCGSSILFFYARKYAVYNLTFYESSTQNGFCFMWGEKDGKRGCNEVCSAMELYLLKLDARKIKEVALYCDNCAGQQKNQAMLSLIANFLKKSTWIEKITLNFLLAGHSMMTVDSIHGVIERCVKKKTVYVPSEWGTIVSNARVHPFPYNVIMLHSNDFKDWKSFAEKKTPLIKSTKNKIKISKIQKAVFTKCLSISEYFTIFNSANEPTEIECCFQMKRRLRTGQFEDPLQLYFSDQPISEAKYRDLVGLCLKAAIPSHLHHEYIDLPHRSTINDSLAEPDEDELSAVEDT